MRGFAWPWLALHARNTSPWIRATFNPHSTCHRPRPGPTLVTWCSGGLPACPGAESTRKDLRLEEKKCRCAKETHVYIVSPRAREYTRGRKISYFLFRQRVFPLQCINVCLSHIGIFFSSGGGSFRVSSAPEHAENPPEHHCASVDPGRGSWRVFWGFKVPKNDK